jgi:hypothetical protein
MSVGKKEELFRFHAEQYDHAIGAKILLGK